MTNANVVKLLLYGKSCQHKAPQKIFSVVETAIAVSHSGEIE